MIEKLPKWIAKLIAFLLFFAFIYTLLIYNPKFIFDGGGTYEFFGLRTFFNSLIFLWLPAAFGVYKRKKWVQYYIILYIIIFIILGLLSTYSIIRL